MTMRASKGEVSRAERIRELLAKGTKPEVIMARTGCKLSDISRAKQRGARVETLGQ